MKKQFVLGFATAFLLLAAVVLVQTGASFKSYSTKLLRFEGKGYGIHKPIWGNKNFTKAEALSIHKHHYWNRYFGSAFVSQTVAEVFIDHMINAGEGKNDRNIKAFEEIIGAVPDGKLTAEDIDLANETADEANIVNAYVDYRVAYYKSLRNKKYEKGWIKRALSFRMPQPENTEEFNVESNDGKEEETDVVEDL